MEVKVGHGPKIFIATKLRPLVGTIVVAVTSHLCFLLLMQFVEQWWGRMESPLRVPSFSVPNYNLFRGISFPGPTLSALRTRRSYFVNSKLCKSLKLAILLISRDEFYSWTMHIDAVVPLTCPLWMRYAVCVLRQKQQHGLRCSISWLTLLTDTESCHTYLFQPVAENDRTPRVRLPCDVRALVGMIPAYCCDSNLLQPLRKGFFIPKFCNFMVTKKFSRTESTENQSSLQQLRRHT